MINSKHLRDAADQIAESYNKLKQNPLDLNLVMKHIGLLSATVDKMLRDNAQACESERKNEY
jgi:hypothetical protein